MIDHQGGREEVREEGSVHECMAGREGGRE